MSIQGDFNHKNLESLSQVNGIRIERSNMNNFLTYVCIVSDSSIFSTVFDRGDVCV